MTELHYMDYLHNMSYSDFATDKWHGIIRVLRKQTIKILHKLWLMAAEPTEHTC